MKHLLKLIIISFFLLSTSISLAQNSKLDSSLFIKDLKYKLGFELKYLYQNTPFNINTMVDPEVEKNRIVDTNNYFSPFMHAALYFRINYEINYREKYKLNFITFFEQRSWSAGVNNKPHYNYYPQFNFLIEDTMNLKKTSVPIYFKMGNMYILDELQTGLKAYNIDVQGVSAALKFGKFDLDVLYIASLERYIGLRIDEFIRSKLQYNYNFKNTKSSISTALSCEYNKISNTHKSVVNLGFMINFNLSKDYRYYFITEYKLANSVLNMSHGSNLAYVLAMQYDYITKNHKFSINPKLRYYGFEFRKVDYNKSYYLYRQKNPIYDNWSNFYPLKNYYRPVSQYAMYVEYYDDYGLYSMELSFNWDWQISRKIGHKLDIELFQLYRYASSKGNWFTYFYYTSFLYFEPFAGLKTGLYISNKQMNRDVQYQTFYQMQYPFFGFHLTYDGIFELALKRK